MELVVSCDAELAEKNEHRQKQLKTTASSVPITSITLSRKMFRCQGSNCTRSHVTCTCM